MRTALPCDPRIVMNSAPPLTHALQVTLASYLPCLSGMAVPLINNATRILFESRSNGVEIGRGPLAFVVYHHTDARRNSPNIGV